MTAFDHERVSHAIGAALAGPGGVALVVKVFCAVPGVVLVPARRGFFRSEPERIQIGDWRYELTADGRLRAAHVVSGIVLAEEVLAAGAVGPHVARALGQLVSSYGPTIVPNIDAALEVLESAPRF
ncbi:DUF5073 family protein [Mycobacterium sp. E3198]|uniref:DUF5073 family protein n=1 Tax=Mycobacterium sp. E3198 TaxID=1834143 RepID=UPI0007FDEDC7|nr:DUF5073 family protein [Mycobacterium sp. E3198]OBG35959.1 DUF5073 domain-containing protein [Mycobacterium sp. E3198]